MKKSAAVKASMHELGMAFLPGERVRVWYRNERKWTVATVRSVTLEPHPSSRSYYQVRCAGKDNPRYYRAEELQPFG